MFGKKRNKTNLSPIYPKYKRKSDYKKKKKSNEYLNKYYPKSQGNNKTRENFIQIINLFPYSYDKSNNINMNYTENKSNDKSTGRSMIDLSLNNVWINCINDALSQSKKNNENVNKIEESTPPCNFKIKELNNFSFANSNNSSNSNNKNRIKDSEKFIEIEYKKENNNLPAANDVAISNNKCLKADSQLSIKKENTNN